MGWGSLAKSFSVLLWLVDSGISLENGVYAAAVVPGSPAAKEGSLAVGDRIVAVSPQQKASCLLPEGRILEQEVMGTVLYEH